jgi:nucleotidyltransferase substrate binding protein (TIGR01987 family)
MSKSRENFKRALTSLEVSVASPVLEPRDLSGILKNFEMAYELAWKSLKRRLLDEGHQTQGSKDVFSKAYQLNMISDEAVWLEMINDRNACVHVYDEAQAMKILDHVKNTYLLALKKLESSLP